ncbi:uncharacterized protein BKCO1_4000040 [Diplodia corticola]|uniref:Uncharacterized protein n=1 Tax=Diplodia corticola TaxID=236234 RepID=A0A1J9RWF6_9PEZI|nr:uncharacterized protein BKCO1_4000040 [Diplodia corticola]OJD32172.1 hypothetical protein BKCO1_4000040 [Diplodia corticola]
MAPSTNFSKPPLRSASTSSNGHGHHRPAHPSRQNTTASSTTTRTSFAADIPTPSRHNSSSRNNNNNDVQHHYHYQYPPQNHYPQPPPQPQQYPQRQPSQQQYPQRQPSQQLPRRKPVPTRAASTLSRPTLSRAPTTQTAYIDLLVRLDEIPRWHNVVCAFCTWLLLAGYLVFPATFTKVQERVETKIGGDGDGGGDVVEVFVAGAVKNVGLLWVAGACCVLGGVGLAWLWVRWWWHWIWLVNRVFLPGTTNSIAGLISTLVNIYSAQDGKISITAKVTVGVTAGCTLVFGTLFVVHQLLLMRVKKKHERQIRDDEKRERRMNGEEVEDPGAFGKLRRKAQEPSAMPGSVV